MLGDVDQLLQHPLALVVVVEVEPFILAIAGDAFGHEALDQRFQEGGDLLGAFQILLAGACHLHDVHFPRQVGGKESPVTGNWFPGKG
ncbi:hypothetical protein D9M69_718610 [compost metagenome]